MMIAPAFLLTQVDHLGHDVCNPHFTLLDWSTSRRNRWSTSPEYAQWLGPDPERYRQAYEKQNHEEADDWSDLIALTETVDGRPISDLASRLDLDAAVTWLALDALTVNLDSYIGSGHNYFLYHRESSDRFIAFPWDPNEAWGCFNMNIPVEQLIRLPLDFIPRFSPPPGQPPPPRQPNIRPLSSKLWGDPEFKALLLGKVRTLLDGAAHPDTLLARMNALRDLIRPWVERDVQKMYSTAQFESSFSEHLLQGMPIPGLAPFIRERADYLRSELDK